MESESWLSAKSGKVELSADSLWINGGGLNSACRWSQRADGVVRNDAQMAACWDSVCLCKALWGRVPFPLQTTTSDTCCHCPALDLWAAQRPMCGANVKGIAVHWADGLTGMLLRRK